MLATSESVTATAIQPACQSVIPAGKSVVSWSISVLATTMRSAQGMTAQSSSRCSGAIIVPISRCKPRSSTAAHLLLPFAAVLPDKVLHAFSLPLPQELLLLLLPCRYRLIERP